MMRWCTPRVAGDYGSRVPVTGGTWGLIARRCRSASRNAFEPWTVSTGVGIHLVRDLPG